MAKPKLSPMMQQYMSLKEQYPDVLLFFRLGDFYEMFFDDAVLVSRELELTLTGRDCGMQQRAPMCGVPFHAVDTYVNRLLEKGHKVAICEQMTDPSQSKGLVERDVVRIITPGTIIESSMLDEKANNYLLSLFHAGDMLGLAYTD
ncbi:MAG: DNA mismatch repair protein MutS, partial [Eubacteriales bacterium]|nr:DNA mismatch repair protein MutS [Eubacteriales bacterium]